jgi:hypothetical protein
MMFIIWNRPYFKILPDGIRSFSCGSTEKS